MVDAKYIFLVTLLAAAFLFTFGILLGIFIENARAKIDIFSPDGTYISSFGKKGKKIAKFIDVGLIYENGRSRVSGVDRISKTSKRIYMQSKDIRPVKNGYGLLVLSTPKGIVTGKFAKENNLGGEALFKIW